MQFVLCNRIQFDRVEVRAGKIIDDTVFDVAQLRAVGAFLVQMPNPVVEARAEIVRKQESQGRREAELDLLVTAIAEFMQSGPTPTAELSFARFYLTMGG